MQGRRRRDEPFNPFAPNASQKAKDRREKSLKNKPKPLQESPQKKVDLAAKQRAALKEMAARNEVVNDPRSEPPNSTQQQVNKTNEIIKITSTPNKVEEQSKPESREERLAKLKEKSAATAQFAKEAKTVKSEIIKEEITAEDVSAIAQEVNSEITEKIETQTQADIPVENEGRGTSNVFKTIKTQIKSKDKKGKKRRAPDKKGGGRQPQAKKLDRRKMLEYKYAAKDLLDNDLVKEEHRSNIVGQIWAKGERTSAESALEFIKQKQDELIIPEDVAQELASLVKRYTIKR